MKTMTTDLEQFEQFNKLYTQLGMAIKQIQAYQVRIDITEMVLEQKELGMEMKGEPESIEMLEQERGIAVKSIRNRASKFITAIIDISKRSNASKAVAKGNGVSQPQLTPVEVVVPTQAVTKPTQVVATEVILAKEEEIEFDIQ